MAEEAPAPAAAAAAAPAPAKPGKVAKSGKKKASAPRKKDAVSLPKLVVDILTESKERKGISVAAIKKNLGGKGVDVQKANKRINTSLAKLVSNGSVVQVKGTGASGSFKIAKVESVKKVKEVKKSPVKVRKPVAKKSPAKKQPAKKPVKKPAAKKSPVKKSTPKKAAPKAKPSPKKAVKKPEPKKAAKKVAPKKVTNKSAKKSTAKKSKK